MASVLTVPKEHTSSPVPFVEPALVSGSTVPATRRSDRLALAIWIVCALIMASLMVKDLLLAVIFLLWR